jgi:glycosyltransferase involved in cell wall biosynthesis
MLRFGTLLSSKNSQNSRFDISECYPKPFFSKISPSKKCKKWAAYIDKYLMFPQMLKQKLQSLVTPIDAVHVIDHSNAVYLPHLKKISQAKKIITCHDLVAIRAAKGEFLDAPQTSKSGKRLQGWIHRCIEYADYFACDSLQTLKDLNRLIPQSKKKSSVLHLGTEKTFSSSSNQENLSIKLPFDPSSTNFLLHVGSSAWYKNRKAVFHSFLNIHKQWPDQAFKLVLVGPEPQKEELNDHLANWIHTNKNSIFNLKNLPENTLGELYKYAQALVFPSFIEGFGWPPLEAAIRRCPVITTPTGAIKDLLGDYPIYVDAENQASIDQGVLKAFQVGRSNQSAIILPNHEDCRRQYFDLYEQMIAN